MRLEQGVWRQCKLAQCGFVNDAPVVCTSKIVFCALYVSLWSRLLHEIHARVEECCWQSVKVVVSVPSVPLIESAESSVAIREVIIVRVYVEPMPPIPIARLPDTFITSLARQVPRLVRTPVVVMKATRDNDILDGGNIGVHPVPEEVMFQLSECSRKVTQDLDLQPEVGFRNTAAKKHNDEGPERFRTVAHATVNMIEILPARQILCSDVAKSIEGLCAFCYESAAPVIRGFWRS